MLTPFLARGFRSRAISPPVLRPAVGAAPGPARTRPMAPGDRGRIRKVARCPMRSIGALYISIHGGLARRLHDDVHPVNHVASLSAPEATLAN